MTKRQILLASALASICFASFGSAHASESEKEKCFGVAKAGQNDCASKLGTHSCAGQAKSDGDANEWKNVPRGSCMMIGGTLSAPR